ncbi:hypothetical protein [Corallococcus macrosporus]|nr:hypothetical protein [Corallococcus macrosporus]
MYTSGAGVPEHVSARPWRGVHHYWDSYPTGLGQHLMARVQHAKGDLRAVVRQLIDEAPWGWSSCRPEHDAPAGKRQTEEEPGPRVAPDETGAVNYVYVFDLEARRLDAFSTCVGDDGKRIGSVVFSPTGAPDLPTLDLLPEERVAEPHLPGDELSAQALMDCLNGLPELKSDSAQLQWVNTAERPDHALSITFRVLIYEDGALAHVEEQEWNAVPPSARREPERVRHFLEALVEVVREDSRWLNSFWIASQDALRRSQARQRERFARILRAHAVRDLGSEGAS